MIFEYIEKSVLRKINIINSLYCTDTESVDTLALKLHCTTLTIAEDISYLQQTLHIPINKDPFKETFYLTPPANKVLYDYLKQVYQTSLFLRFLVYSLDENPQKTKHIDFTKQQGISSAKGYRLRNTVIDFLTTINLKLENNIVTGNPILIRFLKTELTRSFGLDIVHVQEETRQLAHEALQRVEKILHIRFTRREYELYTYLMQTSVDNCHKLTHLPLNKAEKRAINSKLYPYEYPAIIKSLFKKSWQKHSDDEVNFAILAYMAINSHIFDKSLDPDVALSYKNEFLSLPEIQDLIQIIRSSFSVPPNMVDYFYNVLYLFLRDALFKLQPIISSSYLCLGQDQNTYSMNRLKDLLKQWNHYDFDISEQHFKLLSKRLSPLLVTHLYSHLYIVSEANIDANCLATFLKETTHSVEISTVPDLRAVTYEELTDRQNLFIIDKENLTPIQVPDDNVIYIYFPLNNFQVFDLLSMIFK